MKTASGIKREYKKVLRELYKNLDRLGLEDVEDPFRWDPQESIEEADDIHTVTNLIGWARALAWVLGIKATLGDM